jgi:hypothetical protein
VVLTEGNEELVSAPDLREDIDEPGLETDSPEKIFMADAQADDDRGLVNEMLDRDD